MIASVHMLLSASLNAQVSNLPMLPQWLVRGYRPHNCGQMDGLSVRVALGRTFAVAAWLSLVAAKPSFIREIWGCGYVSR
jgi:hypothetical protein